MYSQQNKGATGAVVRKLIQRKGGETVKKGLVSKIANAANLGKITDAVSRFATPKK